LIVAEAIVFVPTPLARGRSFRHIELGWMDLIRIRSKPSSPDLTGPEKRRGRQPREGR
jgi:hypothetical protein